MVGGVEDGGVDDFRGSKIDAVERVGVIGYESGIDGFRWDGDGFLWCDAIL